MLGAGHQAIERPHRGLGVLGGHQERLVERPDLVPGHHRLDDRAHLVERVVDVLGHL